MVGDETRAAIFLKIHKLNIRLIDAGWDIEEKYTNDGSSAVMYHIWAKRCEWHGKFTYAITGHQVVFHESSEVISNGEALLKTVQRLYDKCERAWREYPASIPFQNAKNEIMEDISFMEMKKAPDYRLNQNRKYK